MRTLPAGKRDRTLARAESEIARAIESAENDPGTTAVAVAEAAAHELRIANRTGAALLSAISALGFATARAAARGDGEMACVAQGFLYGVMLASMTKERRLLAVIGHTAGTFVKHVHEAGGDVAAAARGLVGGAVCWAGELDVGAAAAAEAAGRGAAEAADDVSPALGRSVRAALEEPVAGFQVRWADSAERSAS